MQNFLQEFLTNKVVKMNYDCELFSLCSEQFCSRYSLVKCDWSLLGWYRGQDNLSLRHGDVSARWHSSTDTSLVYLCNIQKIFTIIFIIGSMCGLLELYFQLKTISARIINYKSFRVFLLSNVTSVVTGGVVVAGKGDHCAPCGRVPLLILTNFTHQIPPIQQVHTCNIIANPSVDAARK